MQFLLILALHGLIIEDLRRVDWGQTTQGVLEAVADTKTRSVILGNPGSGKSSLLQYLTLSWAKKSSAERYLERLPLFAELRLYGDDKERDNCNSIMAIPSAISIESTIYSG